MAEPLEGATVAVMGFGSQGSAQAQNLRDAGLQVLVGVRPGGTAEARARALGFETMPLDAAARRARASAMLLPDDAVPRVWPQLAPAFAPGAAVVFAHGFSLLYGGLDVPPALDVVLVSPTGPGPAFRRTFESGATLPAYVAVHQDSSGRAHDVACDYARRVGCGPLVDTTVREETEVDLFGEQTVLCGGLNALVTAAFETLVARGYTPEVAYLECVHQVKYLADMLHERGIAGFRRSISGTALYGDLTRGPRVIGPPARAAMAQILDEIRSGAFAREWLDESDRGRPTLGRQVAAAATHPIEDARRSALGSAVGSGADATPERGRGPG